MEANDEDDPAADWPEDAPTQLNATVVAEARDQVTAPHDLRRLASSVEEEVAKARDAGCLSCFSEGQEDVLNALRSLMLETGASNDEVAHTIKRLRGRLTKL
ncbi:MAG TPA: hypothetical protein VNF91_09620 [Candidatus Acidoferrum sp.]|nr:hypothetical protein [Candidatus Acidoferrum sp.]